MSVAFYIVLDEKQAGFETFVNGNAVAKRGYLDEARANAASRSLKLGSQIVYE